MYVNRTCLHNVKSLHRDIPDGEGALPEPARMRLLLQGANGSGKSTILNTIRTLWQFWGQWIEDGEGSSPSTESMKHKLGEVDLAAMEMVGIINGPPLWIGTGKRSEWLALREAHPEGRFAGLIHADMKWAIELPPDDYLQVRYRSLAGSETFPNVVYFAPEGRTIREPTRPPAEFVSLAEDNTWFRVSEKPRAEIIDTTRFNWTAVYDPAVSLDSILLTVKALFPERFDECLRLVNLALEHRQKLIAGFGPKGRLTVKGVTDSGIAFEHPIEELSSGERQILLLVGFVVAFLRPGGIVLIDEPDLHVHVAMVTQLLQTLDSVVQARKGQLIVASHSEHVWDYFSRTEEQIELSPWQGAMP